MFYIIFYFIFYPEGSKPREPAYTGTNGKKARTSGKNWCTLDSQPDKNWNITKHPTKFLGTYFYNVNTSQGKTEIEEVKEAKQIKIQQGNFPTHSWGKQNWGGSEWIDVPHEKKKKDSVTN